MNGAEGIGTGWSTSVPNFNPRLATKRERERELDADGLLLWVLGLLTSAEFFFVKGQGMWMCTVRAAGEPELKISAPDLRWALLSLTLILKPTASCFK